MPVSPSIHRHNNHSFHSDNTHFMSNHHLHQAADLDSIPHVKSSFIHVTLFFFDSTCHRSEPHISLRRRFRRFTSPSHTSQGRTSSSTLSWSSVWPLAFCSFLSAFGSHVTVQTGSS
ncbi:hypothetical protein BLNAU_1602 [Blattamonas nauphoetae]|uniref:Uncharacterized protein n=1 Tax=Blattamonas nauphoetae TaxID=2049346 RepID=A0ABQ9YIX7_9EUKA|nr:hypothetical protein BLNAU_1602 [Blattamonas nauphoetae]